METAKQHNDKLTGEILPIVVDSKFNFKPRLHPMTCGKCGSVINTGLCAKCQLDCQSCLKEHDRELKEALEHRITICDKNLCKFSDSCKGFYGFRNCKIKDEFWKERGIE